MFRGLDDVEDAWDIPEEGSRMPGLIIVHVHVFGSPVIQFVSSQEKATPQKDLLCLMQ